MTMHTLILIIVTLLDILCILAVVFVERKNPAATLAWVLILLVLPVGGFLLYAMFGSGFHVNQKKRYAVKRMFDGVYRKALARFHFEGESSDLAEAPTHKRLLRYLERDGEAYFTNNNDAVIYTDGESMFAAMKDDLRAAQKHIHLLYYIFRNDSLGREIVDILTEKAKNGVAVKVIFDSLGSILSGEGLFRKLKEAGGEVEPFSPLMMSVSSHLRMNYRNHRKITVVDGVIGYVGGMNIGNEYLGKDKRLRPWRDTHLRLVGASVNFLQERFLMDWMNVSNAEFSSEELESFMHPPQKRVGKLGVQIVSSGPDMPTSAIKNGLLELIYSAKRRIYIQTPYFLPDEGFAAALRIAARSGVDVRLMVPAKGDNVFVQAASLNFVRQALQDGVQVYAYNGFLHAKSIVCDSEAASIGTANLDNRSFALNFEVNAFIVHKEFAKECEEIFINDQRNAIVLSEDWFVERPALIRGLFNVCRLFAPLM